MRIITLITCLLLGFSLHGQTKTIGVKRSNQAAPVTTVNNTTNNTTNVTLSYSDTLTSAYGTLFTAYGAIPNDGLSDDSAFQAFLDDDAAFVGEYLLRVPWGQYDLDSFYTISRKIIIEGYGNQDLSASIFQFSEIGGLHFTGTAGWSEVRGMTLKGTGSGDVRGILIQAHGFRLIASQIESFGGTGVEVSTGPGNGNSWYFESTTSKNNGGHGFRWGGDDSNAGLAVNCDATLNALHGFFDASFLGNTFIGCHSATNGDSAYIVTNANARSVFIGCYAEADQGATTINNRSLLIGGLHGAGVVGDGGWLRGEIGNGVNANAFINRTDGSTDYTLREFGHASTDQFLYAQKKLGSINHVLSSTWANGNWTFGPMEYLSEYTDNVIGSRDSTSKSGKWFFTNGMFVGAAGKNNSQAGYLGGSHGVPTAGNYVIGDLMWNFGWSNGENMAWICTSSGTPGTWTPVLYYETDKCRTYYVTQVGVPAPAAYNACDKFEYTNPSIGGYTGEVVIDSSGVNVLRQYGTIVGP